MTEISSSIRWDNKIHLRDNAFRSKLRIVVLNVIRHRNFKKFHRIFLSSQTAHISVKTVFCFSDLFLSKINTTTCLYKIILTFTNNLHINIFQKTIFIFILALVVLILMLFWPVFKLYSIFIEFKDFDPNLSKFILKVRSLKN